MRYPVVDWLETSAPVRTQKRIRLFLSGEKKKRLINKAKARKTAKPPGSQANPQLRGGRKSYWIDMEVGCTE